MSEDKKQYESQAAVSNAFANIVGRTHVTGQPPTREDGDALMKAIMATNPCKPEIPEAFTPGPWWAHESGAIVAEFKYTGGSTLEPVAMTCVSTHHGADAQRANTLLIAAAPELLDACYDALGFLCSQPRYAHAAEIIGLLTAAIDKARAA